MAMFYAITAARANVTYYARATSDAIERARQYEAIGNEADSIRPSHVNDTNSSHETLLQRASRIGNLEAVQTLLRKGADFRGSTILGTQTPLILAALGGHHAIMQELFRAQLQTIPGFSHGNTPLTYQGFDNFPIRDGDYGTLDVLMNSRLKPDVYSSVVTRYTQAQAMVANYVSGKDIVSTPKDMSRRLRFLIDQGIYDFQDSERTPLDNLVYQAIRGATEDQKLLDALKILVSKGGRIPLYYQWKNPNGSPGYIATATLTERQQFSETAKFIQNSLTLAILPLAGPAF